MNKDIDKKLRDIVCACAPLSPEAAKLFIELEKELDKEYVICRKSRIEKLIFENPIRNSLLDEISHMRNVEYSLEAHVSISVDEEDLKDTKKVECIKEYANNLIISYLEGGE